jgi:hypothetical protein
VPFTLLSRAGVASACLVVKVSTSRLCFWNGGDAAHHVKSSDTATCSLLETHKSIWSQNTVLDQPRSPFQTAWQAENHQEKVVYYALVFRRRKCHVKVTLKQHWLVEHPLKLR